eukprot:3202416-Rhodomonas_salina.2
MACKAATQVCRRLRSPPSLLSPSLLSAFFGGFVRCRVTETLTFLGCLDAACDFNIINGRGVQGTWMNPDTGTETACTLQEYDTLCLDVGRFSIKVTGHLSRARFAMSGADVACAATSFTEIGTGSGATTR